MVDPAVTWPPWATRHGQRVVNCECCYRPFKDLSLTFSCCRPSRSTSCGTPETGDLEERTSTSPALTSPTALTPRYPPHSLRAIRLPHSARSTSLRAIHLTGSTSATRTRSSQPDAACSRARLGATGYDVDTACARRPAGPWASSTKTLNRLPAFIVGAPHAPPPGR